MDQLCELKQQLKNKNISFREQEPLKRYTSFKIGGPAALFCLPESREELVEILNACRQLQQRCFLLGLGSNVLFADEGYEGVIICTRNLRQEVRVEGSRITAGCGIGLIQLCRAAEEHGLGGLEFAYGIPGSLGGAVYMNAGAYGGEMKDVLESVVILDDAGEVRTLPAAELALGYRTSIFAHKPWYILEAVLRLAPAEQSAIRARMEELMDRRREKQPLEYPSAGSTFKRPQGAFAGALIEQCGLKGYRVGDAAVSEKHSGFVINLGEATCGQVLQLTQDVQRIVEEKTGFRLEKEVRVIR